MTKTKRLPELDCLRGIAATMVMCFHFTIGSTDLLLFKLGCTGVELFFVISGFVIFLTIEKTTSYKSFLLSRFARLYPAYWACLTITSACIIGWSVMVKTPIIFPHLTDYLVNATMFQYYFDIPNIDGSYWTLIIELLFYLFILVVYLFKTINKIDVLGFVVVLFCLIFGTVIKTFAFPAYSFLTTYFPILPYFPLFIAGIAFYQIKFHKINTSRILLLALCLATQIVLFTSTTKGLFMPMAAYVMVLCTIFALFFLYCFDKLHFIVNRVTLFMGKISYSLYLIHGHISVHYIIPFLTHSRYFQINFWVVIVFFVIPIVIITAALINKFIEEPVMKYLKQKFG